MVSDEDPNPHSGPLGTMIGLLVFVLGVGSTIWWHAPGAVSSTAMGWLMAPLPHTLFKVIMVSLMVAGLLFGAGVVFTNRYTGGGQ